MVTEKLRILLSELFLNFLPTSGRCLVTRLFVNHRHSAQHALNDEKQSPRRNSEASIFRFFSSGLFRVYSLQKLFHAMTSVMNGQRLLSLVKNLAVGNEAQIINRVSANSKYVAT